jgi:hypothetical protein
MKEIEFESDPSRLNPTNNLTEAGNAFFSKRAREANKKRRTKRTNRTRKKRAFYSLV